MKLTILSEAKAVPGFRSEHGLSFLVESGGKRILFDTGASDAFLHNARKLGAGLEDVRHIVLSHGHWDHGNGLQYLDNRDLLCHPGCFRRRFRRGGGPDIGLAETREELDRRFRIRTSTEPVELVPGLWFLGEIPRLNDFEARSTQYVLEDGSDDYISDDSGLACLTQRGLVVISGCAHSGICNMVEHARRVSGEAVVCAVIGGFHLKVINEQALRTAGYLKELHADEILPSHCTMDRALQYFREAFGGKQLLAGAVLEF